MTDDTAAGTGREASAVGDAATSGGKATTADLGSLRFDEALDELRSVVARLEQGGLPLEDSLAL